MPGQASEVVVCAESDRDYRRECGKCPWFLAISIGNGGLCCFGSDRASKMKGHAPGDVSGTMVDNAEKIRLAEEGGLRHKRV